MASIHDVVTGAAIPLDVDGCSGSSLEPLRTCQFTTVDGVPGGFALLSFSGSAKRLRGNCQVFSLLAAVIWSETELR